MITRSSNLGNYREVIEDTPITYTVPSTAHQIYGGLGTKWVTSYLIRVRSMGTATYIRVGNQAAQNYTLKAVGEMKTFSCNPGEVVDATQIYVVSDTADAVIECICSYPPLKISSDNVQEADDGTVNV